MSESTTTSTVHPWPHQPGANDTADDDWLLPLQERRSLFGDLRFILRHELWRHRGLLYELMRRDIRIRYKQAVMGLAWAVLMPILIVTAGALVRVAMAFVGGRPLYPGSNGHCDEGRSLVLLRRRSRVRGQQPDWQLEPGDEDLFSARSAAARRHAGAGGRFGDRPERAARRGSAARRALRCSGVVGAPSSRILVAFTAGSALVVSCANLFFRDVKYIVQVLLSFGIFFTPVFFEPEMFGPTGARLMMLNPLAPILEGLRLSVVYDHNLLSSLVATGRKGSVLVWTPWYLVSSVAWATVMLVGGLLFFHRSEAKFAEYV